MNRLALELERQRLVSRPLRGNKAMPQFERNRPSLHRQLHGSVFASASVAEGSIDGQFWSLTTDSSLAPESLGSSPVGHERRAPGWPPEMARRAFADLDARSACNRSPVPDSASMSLYKCHRLTQRTPTFGAVQVELVLVQ